MCVCVCVCVCVCECAFFEVIVYSLTSLHSCTTDKIELRVLAMYSCTLFSLYSCTVVHNDSNRNVLLYNSSGHYIMM